jgi:Na+:H+ antiporter, NhaA family
MAASRRRAERRDLSPLRDFLATESAGAVLIAISAALALVWANSPWRASYEQLWTTNASVTIGSHSIELDLRHWVNDGLMTVFFLLVGLEIRRELATGHFARRRAAMLPVAAALGGMLVPAALYLSIAGTTAPRGWGIPMATDIALAVGVVGALGTRVPGSARALLLGLAVVDDVGAIIVIAVAYSSGIEPGWLAAAGGCLLLAVALRRFVDRAVAPFVVIGVAMWISLFEAGVHPTLAGVALGLLAPVVPLWTPEQVDVDELNDLSDVVHARATTHIARGSVSVVEWLEHQLHPWSSYLIVPLFALANAGIELSGSQIRAALGSTIAWGVLIGLVVGKPLGVVVGSRLAMRSGVAEPPAGANGRHLLGIGNAAGIGFTVALFITELAFDDEASQADAKLAILVASVVAALAALAVLGRRQRSVPSRPIQPL